VFAVCRCWEMRYWCTVTASDGVSMLICEFISISVYNYITFGCLELCISIECIKIVSVCCQYISISICHILKCRFCISVYQCTIMRQSVLLSASTCEIGGHSQYVTASTCQPVHVSVSVYQFISIRLGQCVSIPDFFEVWICISVHQ
jgi:hypothetical protein